MTRLIALCLLLPGCAADAGRWHLVSAFAALCGAAHFCVWRRDYRIATAGLLLFWLAACSPARAQDLALPMCKGSPVAHRTAEHWCERLADAGAACLWCGEREPVPVCVRYDGPDGWFDTSGGGGFWWPGRCVDWGVCPPTPDCDGAMWVSVGSDADCLIQSCGPRAEAPR